MTPDPNRQWFVYFKDKEMGPFSEVDLHSKLKSGELDGTAYVFTEGMSDWAVVSETPIFAAKGTPPPAAPSFIAPEPAAFAPSSTSKAETAQPAMVKEQISAPRAEAPKVSVKAESTIQTPTAASHFDESAFSLPKATPPKPKVRRGFLYGILAAVVLIAGVYYWMDQGGDIPYLSDMIGGKPRHRILPPPSPTPRPPLATGTNQDVSSATLAAQPAAPAKAVRGFDWTELRDFRKNTDPKGAPFRIANYSFGETHPVIVGVLSPLLKATYVKVAVFPDNEKSLMPVAKIWLVTTSAIDGYFSVGPLNVEGAELPSGRYHLMAATGDNFLGEVTFDVGSWPSNDKLAELQNQLQNDRRVIAEKERSALEMKFREVSAAIDQLRQHGRAASLGAKGARDWARVSKPWFETMHKALDDQRGVMTGPMFYYEAQSHIYNLMVEALDMEQALDTYSKFGQRAFTQQKRKSLGQSWASLSQLQTSVGGEIQILGQAAVGPLKLDPEVIKKQLTEMK